MLEDLQQIITKNRYSNTWCFRTRLLTDLGSLLAAKMIPRSFLFDSKGAIWSSKDPTLTSQGIQDLISDAFWLLKVVVGLPKCCRRRQQVAKWCTFTTKLSVSTFTTTSPHQLHRTFTTTSFLARLLMSKTPHIHIYIYNYFKNTSTSTTTSWYIQSFN